MMSSPDKNNLKKLIAVAAGREPADLVIRNCRIVDVFTGTVRPGSLAVCGDRIAGIGDYRGLAEIDAAGLYAAPGFIDSHIHIESSYLSPEELGRLIVPRGTTTIIADSHEIVNVCGARGLAYMMRAGRGTALDIRWMLPSCVPATRHENSGAMIDAAAMQALIEAGGIHGLGEMMDFAGVTEADDAVLEKLLLAHRQNLPIDGHSPGLAGKALNAYAATRIRTDHECSSLQEMRDRLSCGMYVLLRLGSACQDLQNLLPGVTAQNSRRCLLCTDDCQPRTLLEEGHLDRHLRLCVAGGLDPVTAIQIATLNAAECYGLNDRGALAPGRRADIVLLEDLQAFRARRVFIGGREAASDGVYSLPAAKADFADVRCSFRIRDFSADRLRLPLPTDRTHVIRILPGGVLTRRETATVRRNESGEFVCQPGQDLVKLAVIERHHDTGNVAVAPLAGYGLRQGAIALSIAHDSHNIIVAGADDRDMVLAVSQLARQGGGIALTLDGQVVGSLPLPIAGLMSDQSGEHVAQALQAIHETAHQLLGVSPDVEPVMTLSFMALPVIPEIKLTDMGLFDVSAGRFITPDV